MQRTTFLPPVVGWHNWGDLFTDTAVWQPVVTRICRQTAVSPAHHIQAGYPGSCAVFIVDEKVVVKLFPPMFAPDFERETVVYKALNGRLPHIPRFLAAGVYLDQIDWPYLILEFCPGAPIREAHHLLTPNDMQRIGAELGRMIRTLHAAPVPEQLATSWAIWVTFLQTNRKRTLTHLREKRPFAQTVIDEIETFLSAMEAVWLQKRPLRLLNADLTQDHLLLHKVENQWQISALIDWADAEVGVPYYEWIPMWYGLCRQEKALFQAILTAYEPSHGLDKKFSQILLAYTFLHRFGGEIVIHELDQRGNPAIHNLTDLQTTLLPYL